MDIINKIIRLRNTYQVPKGKIVRVQTPQGVKEYRGGTFVPPNELNNMTVNDSPDAGGDSSPSTGSSPNAAAGGGGMDINNILQQLKFIDLTKKDQVNQASFNLGQLLSIPISTSSAKINPAFRFGAELSAMSILGALPGLQDFLSNTGINVQIIQHQDMPLDGQKVLGQNFFKVGEIDIKTNTIKLWQTGETPKALVERAARFIAHKIGLVTACFMHNKVDNLQQSLSTVDANLQEASTVLQRMLTNFSSLHKGRLPKPGQIPDIDNMQQQVNDLQFQKQDLLITQELLDRMAQALEKEGPINNYVNNYINSGNNKDAVIEQFAHALEKAATVALGNNKTFQDGLNEVAGSFPETAQALNAIFQYMNQVFQQKQQQAAAPPAR